MASLTGQKIKDTYDGLLKTSDSTQGLPESGRVVIQDGLGNDSTLSIGRASGSNGADIDGNLTVQTVFATQLKSDGSEVGLRLESGSPLGTKIRIENTNETYDTFISSRGGNVGIGRVDGVSTNNLNIKKENGYVGIKQKSPLAPLHVKKNGEAVRLESTGDNVCSIDFRQGTTKRGHLEFDNSNDTLEIKTTNPTGTKSEIKFSTAVGVGADAQEVMRIKGDQVVIGNPDNVTSRELYVNGSIETTGEIYGLRASIYGQCDADSYKVKGLNDAPPTATSTGTVGEIRYTANYIYVCVQNNVWKRTELTSW